jgi:hypothetical protein
LSCSPDILESLATPPSSSSSTSLAPIKPPVPAEIPGGMPAVSGGLPSLSAGLAVQTAGYSCTGDL